MRRIACAARPDWQSRVESVGLTWHSGDRLYWDESAFYEFAPQEIDLLESATNDLEDLMLEAAEHVIRNRLYSRLGIPETAVPLIEKSWESEACSVYGRFDFAFDGVNPPNLLEFNADTPTSLLEAAVVQWFWLQDKFPQNDQFNSIHERLIALWKRLTPYLPEARIDFCSTDDAEDGMTVTYLHDTARQAGLVSSVFPIEEVGWNGETFVGSDNRPLMTVFKLYPWEWMIHEEFACHLAVARTAWIEPPWKMILSNKGILPILWSLFPDHPYLLEAHFDSPGPLTSWVKKPLLGREGANVTLCHEGSVFETEGPYSDEGFVYQQTASLTAHDGMFPVIGSWVIGHEPGDAAAGIGVRESDTPITTNTSRFVPNLIG